MANEVILYPLGVGEAYSKGLGWVHFLLIVDGRKLFIDCPGRLQAMLDHNARRGELPVAWADYREILLTHLHRDHAEGLGELIENGAVSPEDPATLYAPGWLFDDLRSHREKHWVVSAATIRGGNDELDRHYWMHALGTRHDLGGFTVECMETRHGIRCVAYKFDFVGYKLGYSADTGMCPPLIEWLSECDFILHEVYLHEVEEDEMREMHTPLADLLELPEAFQKKTHLCHYSTDYREHKEIGHYRFLERNKAYRLV
ncbi:MAG: hypothetical protein KY468_14955 [Armatimonadetes bacterium]|nr:hypothetical protein [Armatimonadota bacterium]